MLDIGSKLRESRLQRRITLKDLAKQTSLTTSFLSQVERNIVSPSLNSLKKISDSLNIRLATLFDEDDKKELVFIRKLSRKKILINKSRASYEIMASGLLNINMRPLLLTLAPGGQIQRKLNPNEQEEFGIIIEGRVELLRQNESYIMEEGDAIYFVSSKPYDIKNIGTCDASILWVSCLKSSQK